MRSFFRSESPAMQGPSTSAVADAPRPRRALAVCLAPVVLMGVMGGVSAAARCVTAHSTSARQAAQKSASRSVLVKTRPEQTADDYLSRLLGKPSVVEDVTLVDSYSLRTDHADRQWSVLCDTNAGDYLVRINARTRRLYAINHIEETRFDEPMSMENARAAYGTADSQEPANVLTQAEARGKALHYLGQLGLASHTLTSLPTPQPRHRDFPAEVRALPRTYNFAFADARHPASKPIVVGVNGNNGQLQSIWTAAHSI